MRTTQAMRYARWSAGIAILLSLVVAYVYGTRYRQSRQAWGKVPAAVPSSVEQRSEGFSFSKMVGNRTEFTVRASKATEFVEGGRSLLEDVWITAYGGAGERFDNLHTHTCDYLTASERISCSGDVQIELDRAADPAKAPSDPPNDDPRLVHVATSHVLFDHKTGLATTDRPVSFRFSQGEGQGVGFRYETQQGEMQLLSAVELALHQADPSGRAAGPGQMLHLSGSKMTFERDQRFVHLIGPVHARQGNFDLVCGKLDVELDEHMYARRLIATDQPVLQSTGATHISVIANTITALASPTRVEAIVAEGEVHAIAQSEAGEDHLEADHVETELDPASNQPRELVAEGKVIVRSKRAGALRNLQTSMLHVDFAPSKKGAELHIKHGVTPAGSIELQDSTIVGGKTAPEHIRLTAQRLEADFSDMNDLQELHGSDGVHFERQVGASAPQTTTSKEMVARFEPGGGWSTVDQSGNVELRQDSGDAHAERAHFERSSDSTSLEGSVVLTDATSRTTAHSATFNETSGEFHAFGRVATVESSSSDSQLVNFAPGPGRASGDRLDANSTTGHAVYSGNARLWQGDSIVEGEKVELDRQTHVLTATGKVHAVFPEAAATKPGSKEKPPEPQKGPSKSQFWHAQGNRLTYWGDEGRGRMEERVHAYSEEGSMVADAMDFFFAPAGGSGSGDEKANGIAVRSTQNAGSGQQLVRASAFGNVKVDQEGRQGTANRGDYTAEDGKFVLSGGTPTVYDLLGNATKGRQLTFVFGDDSISIDSAEGLRTLTLHQVEK
jgi:lipopolysaccharide export system protein LptA